MMNTLVPTAVFSSYPRILVRIRSIIIPPPAPIKPQMNPTTVPLATDWMIRFRLLTLFMDSFVVMTGFTMNLIPSSRVMDTEKLPIVVLGTRLAMKLPAKVNSRTVTIMTMPFLMSRFLFLP